MRDPPARTTRKSTLGRAPEFAAEPDFHAPAWAAPLDVDACIAAIPASATVKGMLILPMVAEAQRRGLVLSHARERYLPFFDYPLSEHVRLLVETAQLFFPTLSLRQGLRKLGRGVHGALIGTTVGKVVWASVDGVDAALGCVAKCYPIVLSDTRMTVLDEAAGRALVRLDGVLFFADSHHVGVFEAALRACNAKGTVATRSISPSAADFLITW